MAADLFSFQTLLFLIAVPSNEAIDYVCPGVVDSPQHYRKVHFEPETRGRSEEGYAKMRFRIFYDNSMDKQPPDFKSFTQEAADFWSEALYVRPNDGTMFIERDCNKSRTVFRYSNESKKYEERCLGQCSSTTTCVGTVVPEDHLEKCTYCLKNDTKCHSNGQRGKGIQNTDMVFYVSALQTKGCRKNVIAYARTCDTDPYLDRPIVGGINICPLTALPLLKQKQLMLSVLKHEIMHALGFSKTLYNHFRDSNGEPLVERDKYGRPTLLWKKGEFGPKIRKTIERKWHVRGGTLISNRTFIVTPNVVREARAHFNCSELEGGELEDFGGNGTAGSHWETRVYRDDLMEGAAGDIRQMSRIDLALLEDTGWYKVNYSLAEPMKYGKDLGCDFCMKSCKYWMDKKRSEGQSVEPFCDRTSEQSANYVCNKTERIYSGCPLRRKKDEVLDQHQYFDKIEGVSDDELRFYSGIDYMADFCPIPLIGNIVSCNEEPTSEEALSYILDPLSNIPLEGFGNDSHCFESRKKWTVNEYKDTCSQVKPFSRGQNASCYKFLCLSDLLIIEVSNKRFPCFFEGQVLEISLFGPIGNATHEGTIVCPGCEQTCGKSSHFKCIADNPISASKYPYDTEKCVDGDYIRNLLKSWDEESNTSSTVSNDAEDAETLESDTGTTIESLTSNSKPSVTFTNSNEESHEVSQAWKLGPSHLIRILFIFLVIINY